MASDSYSERRHRLAASIGDGVALIPAASEVLRNPDVHHPFRQASDFFFLTGFDEPDAVVLLDPSAGADQYVLFVRPRDREREIWNGRGAGVEGAIERFGADAAFSLADLDAELKRRLVGRSSVFVPFARGAFRERVINAAQAMQGMASRFGRVIPIEVNDVGPILNEMRLVKTPDEAVRLTTACDISVEGHIEAMRFCKPGQHEYQLQAAMEYVFRARGSRRDGYPAIVASGPNACILHYTENDRRIEDGDLVLMDAGAEYGYFSSDITRTFPANGTFTAPQRDVYEVVLAAHEAAIGVTGIGSTIRSGHNAAVSVIAEGLVDLRLLPGSADEVVAMHHYREYFMHGTSHWLGMDVHDTGAYAVDGNHRELEAGMSFTIEPGIYVDPERESVELSMLEYDLDEWTERRMLLGAAKAKALETAEREAAPKVKYGVPDEFRGIGIRIEDDMLVTDTGMVNLTAAVPTGIAEIEAICAETSDLPRFESR